MDRIVKVLVGLVICVAATGCATVFKGSTDTVVFNSEPSGAAVVANGVLLGRTPCTAEIKTKNTSYVTFKLDGYKESNVIMTTSIGGGWLVADILLGGLIAVVVDGATGNWNYVDEDHVMVQLEAR